MGNVADPPCTMTPADVARRLGMVLSPAQIAYRQARRAGLGRGPARAAASYRALAVAAQQTQAVQNFIRDHAIWIIPDDAWPRARLAP